MDELLKKPEIVVATPGACSTTSSAAR